MWRLPDCLWGGGYILHLIKKEFQTRRGDEAGGVEVVVARFVYNIYL